MSSHWTDTKNVDLIRAVSQSEIFILPYSVLPHIKEGCPNGSSHFREVLFERKHRVTVFCYFMGEKKNVIVSFH